MFRRHLEGRSDGDWPVAIAGAAVLEAIAARSRAVRLSGETAARQTVRRPDLKPGDHAMIQRILDEGEMFAASGRIAVGFVEIDGKPWRAAVKATGDEPFEASMSDWNDKVYNVLFLCTGNSARGITVECLMRLRAVSWATAPEAVPEARSIRMR